MILTLFILVLSLYLLIKGSDLVVDGAASLASLLRISPFVIGLTVVAIGTSIPELMTNIFASLHGTPEIGIGTIIGSNIVNFGFILAFGFFLFAAPIDKRVFQTNAMILFALSFLFYFLALDSTISFFDGILLLFLFICYLYYLVKKSPKVFVQEVTSYTEEAPQPRNLRPFLSNILSLIFGFALLLIGARYLISSVVSLSVVLGISQKIISLTLIAFGTSLPEFFVTLSSVRKGLLDVFLGNLIGSNISNLLLVIGIGATLHDLPITSFDLYFSFPLMLFVTLLLVHFLLSNNSRRFFTGFLLFLSYLLFLFSLFLFSSFV